MNEIEIRPFVSKADYDRMIDYFFQADESFLRGMGIDPAKILTRDAWHQRLLPDLDRDDQEKQTYYLGWCSNGQVVGHSNVNKIKYGEEAYIHLHIWAPELRKTGLGTVFFKKSANEFIRRFALKNLFCEPYAENPAPNRVLSKLGFRLVKRYRTVPGIINYEQEVNRYVLDHEIA